MRNDGTLGLQRLDDLAERPGAVVVAQRLAGHRPRERLATVDRRPGRQDMQPGLRLVDAVDAVEAPIEADQVRRPADRRRDGQTERGEGRDVGQALPARAHSQQDGDRQHDQPFDGHPEGERRRRSPRRSRRPHPRARRGASTRSGARVRVDPPRAGRGARARPRPASRGAARSTAQIERSITPELPERDHTRRAAGARSPRPRSPIGVDRR